jgi:hypothetical protein
MADKSTPQTAGRSACKHHWVIDPPQGRASKGTCRSCGEERDFSNYIEGGGGWSPTRRNSGGAGEDEAQ